MAPAVRNAEAAEKERAGECALAGPTSHHDQGL